MQYSVECNLQKSIFALAVKTYAKTDIKVYLACQVLLDLLTFLPNISSSIVATGKFFIWKILN